VFGGEARIFALRKEPAEVAGKSSLLAAVDYYVSMHTDIFISASPGNMHNAMMLWYRAYRNLNTGKPNMALSSQLFLNETMEWSEFQWAIQNVHKNRQGQVRNDRVLAGLAGFDRVWPGMSGSEWALKSLCTEKDMAAHSACDFGGEKAEKLALTKYRQVIWQGRVIKTQFTNEELRHQGRGYTPLSCIPQEVEGKASLLAAVDYYVSMHTTSSLQDAQCNGMSGLPHSSYLCQKLTIVVSFSCKRDG
nr:O-fucosyltransferase family protein [Tanacetum cinerariifolium]